MITQPTVFVLGAGASSSYGFPTGPQLVAKAVSILKPGSDDQTKRDLIRVGFLSTTLEDFAVNLANSHCLSIDAFVEARPNYIEIGRCVIAAVGLLSGIRLREGESPPTRSA